MATISVAVSRVSFDMTRLLIQCRLEPLGVSGAALKPWPYGKTLELKWGEIWLTPSEEKWQVLFEMMD